MPKALKPLEQLELTTASWKLHAPEKSFFGLKQNEFDAKVQRSRDVREQIAQKKLELAALDNDMKAFDRENLEIEKNVVKGIAGDPDFGDDSSLYEATNRVRKSERKKGGGRKPADTTVK